MYTDSPGIRLSCVNNTCSVDGTYECAVVVDAEYCYCKLGYHGLTCEEGYPHHLKSALSYKS